MRTRVPASNMTEDEPYRGGEKGSPGNAAVRERREAATIRNDSSGRAADDRDRPLRKQSPWYRRPVLASVVIGLILAVAVGGALWWRHSRNYESTDDAFIDVVAQRVSPQVAGRVTRVLVNDNQDVSTGQVLVELDPADFQNRVEQARARQAQAEAQLAEAETQHIVLDAQREQARATEGVASATANNAANDLRRVRELSAAGANAVSQQQVDRAEAEAELTLSYSQVRASTDGRIARKTAAAGNYVQPGTDLMAVVPRTVYVTANFKETQLRAMRRGQPVEVKIDAYPDFELTGRVDSVQPATGQAFDLLPSQNAAGNWVKVVQRVPVKIVLDQIPNDPERRLAPGMSVTAKVSVR